MEHKVANGRLRGAALRRRMRAFCGVNAIYSI
jgi:hypothetical protein